jgi:hypothetical protein
MYAKRVAGRIKTSAQSIPNLSRGLKMDSEQLKAEKESSLAKKRQGDLVISLTLIVVCAGWLVLTFMIPVIETKLTWPGMLPAVLLGLIILLSVGFLLTSYPGNPEHYNFRDLFHRSLLMVQNTRGLFLRGALTIACLALYLFIMNYLQRPLPPTYSYIISTFIFIVGFNLIFRAASISLALLTGILATGALYVIFGVFYRIPLP